jgi:hypothetical protein
MVEIKINTDTATTEDIKRAVHFLRQYLDSQNSVSSPSGIAPVSPTPSPDYNISPTAMGLFDNDDKISSPDNTNNHIDNLDSKDESDENIEIKPIFY